MTWGLRSGGTRSGNSKGKQINSLPRRFDAPQSAAIDASHEANDCVARDLESSGATLNNAENGCTSAINRNGSITPTKGAAKRQNAPCVTSLHLSDGMNPPVRPVYVVHPHRHHSTCECQCRPADNPVCHEDCIFCRQRAAYEAGLDAPVRHLLTCPMA